METRTQSGSKPEVMLLSKLKDRLLNLNSREQKINLRPYKGATYDLIALLEKTSGEFINKFETSLINSLLVENEEKEISINIDNIFDLIENDKYKEENKERLNYLRRLSHKLYIEKGYRSLYLGFFFLRGYFTNSQKLLRVINAPLFMFPADLQLGKSAKITISKSRKINYTLLYFLRKELEIENNIFAQVITELEKITNKELSIFLSSLRTIINQLFFNGKIQFDFSLSLNEYLENSLESKPFNVKAIKYEKKKSEKAKLFSEKFFLLNLNNKPFYYKEDSLEGAGNFVFFIDKGTNLALFHDFEKIISKFQQAKERELDDSAFSILLKGKEKKERINDYESSDKETLKKTIYSPFFSDPSQTSILQKVFNDFWESVLCIDGPPGTGKTQLISNLLANGLFYDKKILVVCEKNAALQVIANNLNDIGLNASFIKINELSQTPEVYRQINTLVEGNKSIGEWQRELEIEKIEKLEEEQRNALGKINDYCELERDFFAQHNLSLSEVYIKNTRQESIPSEIINLIHWIKTKEELRTLRKDLDSYFRKLSQIFEKSFATCLHLKHLFLDGGHLRFDFNLENKNNFRNVIKDFRSELEGEHSNLLSPIVGAYLLRKIVKKPLSSLTNLLRKKIDEIANLSKKEGINNFFLFLNIQDFAEFQESCLSINFLEKINDFINREFFVLSDLHLLFKSYNKNTQNILLYFLENIFQQTYPASYDNYVNTVEKAVYFNWLNEVEEKEKEKIWDWSISELEKIQKIYSKTNFQKAQLTQKLIQNKQKEKIKNLVLDKELSAELKRKRSVSLRKIFPSLVNYFSIWLTTPETISFLTSLEDPLFDYLIFDEASQVSLEKAIPLFARAKKLIIIGDQQQLPPTDFFKSFWEEEEEWLEENEQEEKEELKEIGKGEVNLEISDLSKGNSLLDYAKKYSSQTQSYTLTWHYRSHYPQLIEFSNQAFYGGKLEIISKYQGWEKDCPPVEYHKVDGHWINQENLAEAKTVLELLEGLPSDKAVGIVTFNAKQRDLLEGMIERKKGEINNLFIRNLEEVQGDERDIIIFSIGYGPNEEEKFIHNFGPLNREGGEKRLNVAITRAREKVILVTSILPSQLNVDSAKNLGPKFLKLYLEYAWACQKGNKKVAENLLGTEIAKLRNLNYQENEKSKRFSSPLEGEIYNELVKLGYEVDSQVGTVSRQINLAVRNPKNKQHILEIECDGWNYLSTKEQIEQDSYRQMLLEWGNWKMMKVLSRDWWKNKNRQVKRIEKEIKNN